MDQDLNVKDRFLGENIQDLELAENSYDKI